MENKTMKEQNSEAFAERTAAYKTLAETYLFRKYGVDRLDRRFAEYRPRFIPAPWRETLRQMNPAALEYISLLNEAHLERLSDADRAAFEDLLHASANVSADDAAETDATAAEIDATGAAAAAFLERTYRTVLAGNTKPGEMHRYFADIHDIGTIPGDAIVFVFSDVADYDSAGNRNPEAEEKKNRVFASVRRQFEAIAAETGDDVRLIRY